MLCGGTGSARIPTEEERNILLLVKPQVEEQIGHNCIEFDILQLKSQVVAGINYFAKVHIGDGKHIHIRVYQPLPGQGDLALHGIQEKLKEDALEYFDRL